MHRAVCSWSHKHKESRNARPVRGSAFDAIKMIEKLDIEIDPLEEGLEIGGIVVGKPVALGQHADQNLVAVSSIDAVSIGTFKLSTLKADVNEIMDQYKAEIRSVRRNTAGQPSQVVIRVRRKPEEAGSFHYIRYPYSYRSSTNGSSRFCRRTGP